MNIGFAVASVGGAALAGLLIAQFGIATALLVDAASFLAIAIVLALTRGLPGGSRRARAVPRAVRRRHALRPPATRRVRLLLIGEALALVLFTLVVPIEVIYAKESLGTSNAGFGILLASWGAGIVVGSLVYLLVKQRSPLGLIVVSTALVGVAYLGLATADTLLVACADLGRRRSRQRRPVDLGRDLAAGDARRPTTRRGSSACSSRSAPRCPASDT